jgi:hypothetical protein
MLEIKCDVGSLSRNQSWNGSILEHEGKRVGVVTKVRKSFKLKGRDIVTVRIDEGIMNIVYKNIPGKLNLKL